MHIMKYDKAFSRRHVLEGDCQIKLIKGSVRLQSSGA